METLRVHYCLDKPRYDRKCRAKCGHWTSHYTDDHALVTCKACRKLLALPPHSSKPTAMTKLSSILPFALILLAACDTDGSTTSIGSDITGSSSAGSSLGALSETSGSGDSTGGESTGGEGMGSTEPSACFGDQCDGQCGPGLVCAPHPDNASLAVCAAPCTVGDPCGLPAAGCEDAPAGECRVGFMGIPLCFPVDSDGEGMGSGGVEACWADECGEDMPCGKNLACLPHPINGAMVCAASNCDPSVPCAGLTAACPVTVPQGVCIKNESNHGWCYPQVCVAAGDCAVGSACVDGYCY